MFSVQNGCLGPPYVETSLYLYLGHAGHWQLFIRSALVEKYVDSKGINRVKGSRFLKGSQAYTRQFLRLFDWLYILWCYGIYIWAAYQMDQQFEKVLFWTFFESISRNFYGCGKLL